ncbi:hypothetical protein KsCSTR_19540 [Candidatus Kuenenia stuttgartiensis]|uniref:Uncharacterized protein n=1 Tax=Kuenenia stuttgartiensis TaxID=174633 RepID=Q1Q2K5_KUEST|nr:hypothetical protein KsCSTR_19540 [Candidatus Kuenenia stuttgartiensis]CAJ74236.1 unknown protein [Candidatus Kuenenia stuttgartiensis]
MFSYCTLLQIGNPGRSLTREVFGVKENLLRGTTTSKSPYERRGSRICAKSSRQ